MTTMITCSLATLEIWPSMGLEGAVKEMSQQPQQRAETQSADTKQHGTDQPKREIRPTPPVAAFSTSGLSIWNLL